MRKLTIVFLLIFVFASPGWSKTTCVDLIIGSLNKKIKSASVKMTVKSDQKADLIFFAEISKSRFVQTPFGCSLTDNMWLCIQDQGAGDFELTLDSKNATLKSSYLNLSIGSVKGVVFTEKGSINEDFALFDPVATSETEDLDSVHSKEFIVKGNVVECKPGVL